uniref:CYTH domain-containing protein n=1 Tax=Steinernema glaseri TaxID=37863 RepID=A0A1I7Y5I1_9BILA
MTDESFVKSITMKARVDNLEAMSAAIFSLTDSQGESAAQEDIYFTVTNGHLKLRINHPSKHYGTLIHYKNNYRSGININEARVTTLDDVEPIKKTLSTALGVLGLIEKERRVYVKDNIRINLDEVDKLGLFVYIEVFTNAQDVTAPMKSVMEIQKQLGIKDRDVIAKSYIDMLLEIENPGSRSFDDETNSSDASY